MRLATVASRLPSRGRCSLIFVSCYVFCCWVSFHCHHRRPYQTSHNAGRRVLPMPAISIVQPLMFLVCSPPQKGPASYITLVIVTEKAPGVCRAWNGGVLTSLLTCIKSTCDSSLNIDLLLSPLELTCDLAGVPISSAVVSSAIQAATTTAIVTSYVTDTVTQSYYWQSSFATIATTVVIPVTDSNGRTVIVAFPVTIEPSTTIYGSPSTSTPPDARATSNPTSTSTASIYNFGTCSNPGIVYGYALDGESQYSFEPADQSQFPRGASPDIASVESFICRRLCDKCDASDEAQQACNDAFNAYSGLAGQNAADVWNIALGLPVTTLPVTTTTVTVLWTAAASASASTSTSTSTSITTDLPTTTATATTTTTRRPLGLGDPGTLTATVTSTIVPGVSSGHPNADGGGSPFDPQNFATQWRPEMLSGGMVLLAVIFALLY